MIPRAMLAVAYATGRAPMPDRSRVMTQTKRDTLVLQVGGLALLLRKSKKGKSRIDLNMVERDGDG
jgi:hypothetical protein